MKFLTADPHFNHYNIALHCLRKPWMFRNPKYDDSKPFHFKYNNPWAVDLTRMTADLIKNWNGLVTKKDEVIIAGDFAYSDHKSLITWLNGKKILCKGNHDKANRDFYNEFDWDKPINLGKGSFDVEDAKKDYVVRGECISALKRFKNGDIDINDCATYILSAAWAKFLELNDFCSIDEMSKECYDKFSEVHEMGCRKHIEGKDVTICHYGMRTWASSFHGSYLAHGHSHGRLPEFDNMMSCDIGIDVWGYAPCPWDAFLRKMEIKEEWIKKNGKYPVDGESKAEGMYDKDADVRVIEVRKKNKAIMKDLGYPINEAM